LVKQKYRLLCTPRRRGRLGPKGPSRELIEAVVEMKRRNPYFGCRKIAEQISSPFGIDLNKDVVRRTLIGHYRPGPRPERRPLLASGARTYRGPLVERRSFPRRVNSAQELLGRGGDGHLHPLDHRFWVTAANIDGIRVCRMFNRAIAKHAMPRRLSSDHDPLFRFHRWRANLRVLEVEEIKTIPGTPRSHAFVERLIGTIRREYLDRIWFWSQSDLEWKLEAYKTYYNQHRCHTGLAGVTPAQRSGAPAPPLARFDSYRWRQHCNGLFQTPAAA